MNTDTPETDAVAELAHNLCLDYDCQGKDDDIPRPIVVHSNFARSLERERDQSIKLIRRLLRSHGEKSSRRSVNARTDAGLWLATYDANRASNA